VAGAARDGGVPRLAHLTSVVETEVHEGVLRATRETDDGYETWEVPTPAVVSLAYARDADDETDGRIDVWTASDLVAKVHENDKRFGQTGSPTRVLAVRDVTPERAGDRYTDLTAAVERIRALAAERGPEPTGWDKPERLGEQPRRSGTTAGRLPRPSPVDRPARRSSCSQRDASFREARRRQRRPRARPDVSDELARHGADRVLVLDLPEEYHPELWSRLVCDVLREQRPHVLLFPATANGRDLAPRVAGELELGMTGTASGSASTAPAD
jgi:hypothetical protein